MNIPPAPVPASPWPAWRPAPPPQAAAEAADRRRRGLRREAAVRSAVGLAIAALLALWKPLFAAVVAAIALVRLAVALAFPSAYGRIAGGLERFGHWVGRAMTWLLMPLLFYGLFLPVGLALRAAGKLRITRGADPARATYWEAPEPGQGWGGGGADSYRRQF
jgi:hypothetical protein